MEIRTYSLFSCRRAWRHVSSVSRLSHVAASIHVIRSMRIQHCQFVPSQISHKVNYRSYTFSSSTLQIWLTISSPRIEFLKFLFPFDIFVKWLDPGSSNFTQAKPQNRTRTQLNLNGWVSCFSELHVVFAFILTCFYLDVLSHSINVFSLNEITFNLLLLTWGGVDVRWHRSGVFLARVEQWRIHFPNAID